VQAVATSALAIVITALSGSIQNWRMGVLDPKQVVAIGFPALFTAQLGVLTANFLPARFLLVAFGGLLLLNVYLVEFRKQVVAQQKAQDKAQEQRGGAETRGVQTSKINPQVNPQLARLVTGGIAGFLAGMFGVGGGVIMVPLQILLLNQPIKRAIQTSLGVIVITAIAATVGHGGLWPWLGNQLGLYDILGQGLAWNVNSNVLWLPGLLLGSGGLIGAQLSTRLLPKLPDRVVSFLFRMLLVVLACYIFWQAK
jgi:uncharacterized membrane protein YfcA